MSRRKVPDLTGQHFGKWTVVSEAPRKDGHTFFFCRCECGTELKIRADALTRNRTSQCSQCAQKERIECFSKRTPEEVREYIQTHTTAEAAKHYGLTKGAMSKYMSNHGIKAVVIDRSGQKKGWRETMMIKKKPNRQKPSPERVVTARKEFNSAIVPHIEPGQDLSPHRERRWKWSGKDYIARMHSYERMVSG